MPPLRTSGPLRAPEGRSSGHRPDQVPFESHVGLLQFFLARRAGIVERIESLLNARRRPIADLQDRTRLFRDLEDAFFAVPGIPHGLSSLRGHLEEAHWASGFRPRAIPGLHNGLLDPGEMLVRGFHLWQQTRWPGRSGRVRYAHTLFDLYVVRCLTLLAMRLWDAGPGSAGERLLRVQGVLDRLWAEAPADQPVFVRDARWLIQIAQSPATDDLGAYFPVAEQVAGTLPAADRLEIHKAGVRMAAGHLRSQIRHYSTKRGVPLDDESLVAGTRSSNALDFALLIQDLVPLLDAYERAWCDGDEATRLELAGAICQGVSPDPELFVNRMELLAAYSMIEHLFVTTDGDGRAVYTPMGRRHVGLTRDYAARIRRVARPLADDCPRFRPVAGACSPYGILYGFSSDLVEHMALKALQPDAVTRFSLEDVFADGEAGAEKLAWVRGWRALPHVPREVAARFDYPQPFADAIFERIARALRARVSEDDGPATVPTGRLFIPSAGDRDADSRRSPIPELPVRYVGSSDAQLVAAQRAVFREEPILLSERREGKCVLSYRTPGGWVAITKAVLTEVLGAGRDATIAGLPPAEVEVLCLTCPDLVVTPPD